MPRRGGQIGNTNAVKHGRTRKAYREERRAEAQARFDADLERSRAWMATIPVTDYAAICAAIVKTKPKDNR